MKKDKPIIGWREWVELPQLGIKKIKAKVDTGARTSSLHAFDLEYYRRNRKDYVKFTVKPEQKSSRKVILCHAPLLEHRRVKSSNGQSELRPVILTDLTLLGLEWPIELTLTNRDEMGFRMLLGRESFRGRFLIDAGKSFLGEKALKPKRRK